MSNVKTFQKHGEISVIFGDNTPMEHELFHKSPILTISSAVTISKIYNQSPLFAKSYDQVKSLMEKGFKVVGHDKLNFKTKKIKKGSVIIELGVQIISSIPALDIHFILWGTIGDTKISVMDAIQFGWEITNDSPTTKKNQNKHGVIKKYLDSNPRVGEAMHETIIQLSQMNTSNGFVLFEGESKDKKNIISMKISWDKSKKIKIYRKTTPKKTNTLSNKRN